MDKSRLAPDSSLAGEKKQRAIQDAKDMYQQVLRNCERTKTSIPPYEFLELIGKGAFGRVYKCKEKSTNQFVAIKIVDTDEVDYQQDSHDKDDTIRDFRKEVTILQQLKDSNAKNVNMIHDAFDLQQQLWIVSDYCTGGSVRTLMRAQPANHPGLEEHFIIPIARELALAMKSVHSIGVIHRDIKCTNVYVTEEGDIQLGDFGIVGVLDDVANKRQTMIGTPHYMPREMLIHGTGNQVAEAYGTEVDVWSFGCTVYEMATGQPPNAIKRQDTLKNELRIAPRLEGDQYSQGLRDFVSFCLNSDPIQRPTAEQVLQHPFVASTQNIYPTRKLIDLIHRFKMWENSGGVRQSLFMAGGAPPVGGTDRDAEEDGAEEDEWNFSTSDSFNEAHEKRYSQMMFDNPQPSLDISTPTQPRLSPLDTGLSAFERLQQQHKDMSANRGERSLDRIFTAGAEPYELHTPIDDSPPYDLPLRKFSDGTTRESHVTAPTRDSQIMIDLDTGGDDDGPSYNFDFGDGPTLKAKNFGGSQPEDEDDDGYRYTESEEDHQKRATMDWKFPSSKPPAQRATMDWKFPTTTVTTIDDAAPGGSTLGSKGELSSPFRPTLQHRATEPVGQFREHFQPFPQPTAVPIRESMASMIDLDRGLSDPADIARPSTASSTAESTMTDITTGNPFEWEEDPAQKEMDQHRFSYHKQWQSEGGQFKRSSHRGIPMHTRGSSLSSTASDLERPSTAISHDDDDDLEYRYINSMRDRLTAGRYDTTGSETEQWPDFGTEQVLDKTRHFRDVLQELPLRAEDFYHRAPKQPQVSITREPPRQLNGNAAGRRPSTAQIEVDFPRIVGPRPEALVEGADPNMVEGELTRMLEDFGQSLLVTAQALRRYAGLEEEEESNNETGPGESTEDDDEVRVMGRG